MLAGRRWEVQGVSAEVRVTDPGRLDEACAIAEERIHAVAHACGTLQEDSELSRLRGRASDGVRVSPLLADLVQVALDAAADTSGAVDPILGAAFGERPRVRLEDDRLFLPDGVALDLGATAWARTADAAAAIIASVVRCGVLVDLGGGLATRGPAPAEGWQVTVEGRLGDPSCVVSVPAGVGLATSSAERRSLTRAGRRTMPVWRSVSVLAHSAVTASTLATAAVVDGSCAVARLIRAGRPARLVDAAGGVTLLNGWPPAGHALAA